MEADFPEYVDLLPLDMPSTSSFLFTEGTNNNTHVPNLNFLQDLPESKESEDKAVAETSSKRKPPKKRIKYTPSQVSNLEQAFRLDHYVTFQRREELAAKCNLDGNQVRNWFQNRRKKESRQKKKRLQFEETVNKYLLCLIQSANIEMGFSPIHQINFPMNFEDSDSCPHDYFHRSSLRCPCKNDTAESRSLMTTVDWTAVNGSSSNLV